MRNSIDSTEQVPITGQSGISKSLPKLKIKEKNVGLRICILVCTCIGILGGIIAALKIYWYDSVMEERETDLRFNLDAKYLPVVYGVGKIKGIPIFVDTLNTDNSVVFTAYALSEGEIGGIYDIHFEANFSLFQYYSFIFLINSFHII